jgi:hypothetical protein
LEHASVVELEVGDRVVREPAVAEQPDNASLRARRTRTQDIELDEFFHGRESAVLPPAGPPRVFSSVRTFILSTSLECSAADVLNP